MDFFSSVNSNAVQTFGLDLTGDIPSPGGPTAGGGLLSSYFRAVGTGLCLR